jgi:probable rRNA maturation factor
MSASRTRKTERRPSLSLSIQLGDGVAALPASRDQLRRWASAAIEADATLTLRFVGQAEGRMLNREYRGRDYATNVLTFAYDAPAGAAAITPGAGGEPTVQADIVICVPVLEREARDRRIPLAHHLGHLVVHGVLHACGHDHEHDDEAREMEARETALLARFRIPDPYRG